MYGLNAIIICNPWTLDIIKIHFVCLCRDANAIIYKCN